MAFNPFHRFRKQQKVIFAILTIICMLTFVLAGNFAGGDALDWVVGLFGGGRKRGEVVTTLYGSKIYDAELGRQRYDRKLANTFMFAAMQAGALETATELRREVLKPLPREASQLDFKYRDEVKYAYLQSALSAPDKDQTAVLKKLYPNDPRGPLAAAQADLQRMSSSRFARMFQPDPLADLKRLLTELLDKKMEREAQLVAGIIMGQLARLREPYFSLALGRQDLLDERVWWHHADRLGIKLTNADIRAEVNRLSPVKDILTDNGIESKMLRDFLAEQYKGADLPTVYKALANELRASMAQGIVLGAEPGLHGVLRQAFRRPAGITPAEYVHFYDQQRTTLTLDLIPVPAEAFLSPRVPEPTEKQLTDFFERYAKKEPNPATSTPGFKEAHRIGLEWIALARPTEATFRKVARLFPAAGDLANLKDPAEQHYLNLANAVLKPELKPKDRALFLGGTGIPLPMPTLAAPGPLGPLALSGAWTVLGRQALLDRAYEKIREDFPQPALLEADPALSYYTALNLPTSITSMAGMGAPDGASGLPFKAIVTYQTSAFVRGKKSQADALKEDVKKRAQLVAGLTLASLGPALTRATTWASVTEVKEFESSRPMPAATPPVLPRYVNREALRFQISDEAASNLARAFQDQDLADLSRAITDASKDPETAPKAVAAALKRYPWLADYVGRTDHPVDRYTLATSPRYRFLLKAAGNTPQTLSQRLKEAAWYFGGDPNDPNRRFAQDFLPEKLFTPAKRTEPSGFSPEPWLLVWKTADIPARTPASLTEIRARVLRAWRMQEARKLARKEAEKIRDQVAGKTPAEALKILRGILAEHPSWGYLIHLDKVARQVPLEDEDAATPAPRVEVPGTKGPTTYSPYRVPEEDIAYPPANFVDQVIKLPAHKATVLADRPLKHFYVVYAESRSAPASPDAVLARTFPKNVSHDIRQNQLWKEMERDRNREFHEEMMKELRRQAGTLNAQGRFALSPNLKSDENRGNASLVEE